MPEQRLVLLLLKVAAAASLASILLRWATFKRLIGKDERTGKEQMLLAFAFSLVYGTSVATRLITRNQYMAVDLGLEGSFLAGLVGGYSTGLVSGMIISLPALFAGEYLTMALFAAAGIIGGLLRDSANDGEEIWRLTPFFDLGLYRILFRWRNLRRAIFQLGFYGVTLFLEFLRASLSESFSTRYLFALETFTTEVTGWETAFIYASTLVSITVSLVIWNSARYEGKLESQKQLLSDARMAALMRQINPHFLFNTLNTISSLIRVEPERAREMIYKLSTILRRLLKNQDSLCPLREEIAFIDDYLAIEMVRFGAKLRVVKSIGEKTCDCLVPSMMLQPIVENSIRHGLGSKLEGGTILLKSEMLEHRVRLTIEDDGVGIPEDRLATLFEAGIGVSNVNERLKVLFGDNYRMGVDSREGEYTRTEIDIPLKQG
jgi:two-component system, LytTR family, sensor kinase